MSIWWLALLPALTLAPPRRGADDEPDVYIPRSLPRAQLREARDAALRAAREDPVPVGVLAPPDAVPTDPPTRPARRDGLPFTCRALLVADLESGQLLYGQNVTEELHPASTTKILTTLLALEAVETGQARLDDVLQIDKDSASVAESGLWMQVGEHLTLRELLIGVMVRSANDASYAVARYLGGGNVQVFVDRMNRRAAELGCRHSHFVNPHGLHIGWDGSDRGAEHYTSAWDLLRITCEALRHPFFRELCLMDGERVSWQNLDPDPQKKHPPERIIHNRNRLLDTYAECVGVKTGYTKQAGACLVSAARRGDREVVAVTLRSASGNDRWVEAEALLRWALDEFRSERVLTAGRAVAAVPVTGGAQREVALLATRDLTLLRHRLDARPAVRAAPPRSVPAPLSAGLALAWAAVPGAPQQPPVALVTATDVPDRRGHGRPVGWAVGLLLGIFGYGTATEAHRRRRYLLASRG